MLGITIDVYKTNRTTDPKRGPCTDPGHIHTEWPFAHSGSSFVQTNMYIKYLVQISQTLNELFQVHSGVKTIL
jgi:hypothetical protein